jgi:hypothetical protein
MVTARCPFCEAVHPVPAAPGAMDQRLHCPCGATGLLCAPNTEPETSVRLAEIGLSDTKADIIDPTLSIVWAREWWRRSSPSALLQDESGS